jgi:hypothetical protein
MNDQDHSLSLSDPDRSLVLSHLLVNFLKNLVSCQTSLRFIRTECRRADLHPHRRLLTDVVAEGLLEEPGLQPSPIQVLEER